MKSLFAVVLVGTAYEALGVQLTVKTGAEKFSFGKMMGSLGDVMETVDAVQSGDIGGAIAGASGAAGGFVDEKLANQIAGAGDMVGNATNAAIDGNISGAINGATGAAGNFVDPALANQISSAGNMVGSGVDAGMNGNWGGVA